MGIKHLVQIRALLKAQPSMKFSRHDIRSKIPCNYPAVVESMKYLVEIEGSVEKTKFIGDRCERYQWK